MSIVTMSRCLSATLPLMQTKSSLVDFECTPPSTEVLDEIVDKIGSVSEEINEVVNEGDVVNKGDETEEEEDAPIMSNEEDGGVVVDEESNQKEEVVGEENIIVDDNDDGADPMEIDNDIEEGVVTRSQALKSVEVSNEDEDVTMEVVGVVTRSRARKSVDDDGDDEDIVSDNEEVVGVMTRSRAQKRVSPPRLSITHHRKRKRRRVATSPPKSTTGMLTRGRARAIEMESSPAFGTRSRQRFNGGGRLLSLGSADLLVHRKKKSVKPVESAPPVKIVRKNNKPRKNGFKLNAPQRATYALKVALTIDQIHERGGISLYRLQSVFPSESQRHVRSGMRRAIADGYVERVKNHIRLTRKGKRWVMSNKLQN